MLIEELIEKAFSDGYEYAQKEFISNRDLMRMNKRINTNIKKYNKNLRENKTGKFPCFILHIVIVN